MANSPATPAPKHRRLPNADELATAATGAHGQQQLILGIESSCDETGLALCSLSTLGTLPSQGQPNQNQPRLLAHALHSQINMHQAYGGVVPELASRDHIKRFLPLLNSVLDQANTTLQQLAAIAVTTGPGLPGALMAGTAFAHGLGFGLNIPVLAIHHLEGHLLSPLLSAQPPSFPFVALLVSGGHSQWFAVEKLGSYALLGETQDDAAGEAFDKTAKMLGLPYPGGPALAALAQQGDPKRFVLPRPMLHSGNLNMSFSGLKTAVMTTAMKCAGTAQVQERFALQPQDQADLAASFQAAVVEVLAHKAKQAMRSQQAWFKKHQGTPQLVVAGGVGANKALRQTLMDLGQAEGFAVFYPEPQWCTDNGAMIALAGAMRIQAQGLPTHASLNLSTRPRWPLGS